MIGSKLQRQTVAAAVLVAFASGCANQPGQQQAQTDTSDCNAVGAAIVGGIIGALLGGGKNRASGAALGAAVGGLACVAINSSSRQTKTASQVERQVVAERGGLPSQPTVLAYTTSVNPNAPIRRGVPISVASDMEIVSGQQSPLADVKEEIILSDPDGKEFRRATKAVAQSGQKGSGGFQNVFSFQLPESGPQGVYGIRTQLYVNGAVARTSDQRVQVVENDRSDSNMVSSLHTNVIR